MISQAVMETEKDWAFACLHGLHNPLVELKEILFDGVWHGDFGCSQCAQFQLSNLAQCGLLVEFSLGDAYS